MEDITYNVRIYKTEVYRGKRVTTYYVRWKVGGRERREPFRQSAQADSFRSSLILQRHFVIVQREGRGRDAATAR
jgi:hypothetical protein